MISCIEHPHMTYRKINYKLLSITNKEKRKITLKLNNVCTSDKALQFSKDIDLPKKSAKRYCVRYSVRTNVNTNFVPNKINYVHRRKNGNQMCGNYSVWIWMKLTERRENHHKNTLWTVHFYVLYWYSITA